jgi:hypothetical protein
MTIDLSLRLGDLVSFLGFAGGGLMGVYIMKRDIHTLSLQFGFLEKSVADVHKSQNEKIDQQSAEISRFAELLNLMGRYEERMIVMRRDLDDFERWRESQQEK